MIGQKQFEGQPKQSWYTLFHPLQISAAILAWVVDEKFNPTTIARTKKILMIILFFITNLLIVDCLYLNGMTQVKKNDNVNFLFINSTFLNYPF